MDKLEYPKVLYPVDGGAPVTVADESEHKALGKGYGESPAKPKADKPKGKPSADDKPEGGAE